MTTTSQSCTLGVRNEARFPATTSRALERIYGDDQAFVCFMCEHHRLLEDLIIGFHFTHQRAPLEIVVAFLHAAITTPSWEWLCRGFDGKEAILSRASVMVDDAGMECELRLGDRQSTHDERTYLCQGEEEVAVLEREWCGIDEEGVSTFIHGVFELGHMVWGDVEDRSEYEEAAEIRGR